MGSNPFGIGQKKSDESAFRQTLFYFMREFKVNPFDEEFMVYDTKDKLVYRVVKKGIPQARFISLLDEMGKHYKKEAAQMKKGRR